MTYDENNPSQNTVTPIRHTIGRVSSFGTDNEVQERSIRLMAL